MRDGLQAINSLILGLQTWCQFLWGMEERASERGQKQLSLGDCVSTVDPHLYATPELDFTA